MASLFWILAVLSLLMLAMTLSSLPAGAQSEEAALEQRVATLLGKMTLEEKLDYIGGVDRFYIRSIPRLEIPRLKMADGPLGVRNYGPSTAMAAGIALAASWDAALAERLGAEIGRDSRARGIHFLLGPGVNIYRAPMNGRNFEYFGEDPFLAASIAVSYIKGVQGQGVSATVKHFVGNNSEFDRRESDAEIDERTLHEIYLPAFEAAVRDAGVGAVMTSYNRTNGQYMSQNGPLNVGVLKDEWGFDGIVMSDWTSTFDGVAAANGGLDLEMPSAAAMSRDVLQKAIEQGRVATGTIDDKVKRILRTAVRFGWLDRDQTDLSIPRYNRQGASVALDAARGSMVLLKNEEGILPLNRDGIKNIAVIGPDAHPAVPVGGGSAHVVPFRAVSFLEGLSSALNGKADVYYHQGIADLSDIADATPFYTSIDGRRQGLRLELFDNMELSGIPARTCSERSVGAGECAASVPQPFTSARWTGFFTPPVAGDYDVFVQIPGERIGYRLYVDRKLVVDAWDYPKALLYTRRVAFPEGAHEVVLELVRRGSGFSGGKLRLGIAQSEKLVDPVAVSIARRAEAVVVAVGFSADTESESGDRSFRLPLGQDALIRSIAEANKNTIVVITSGGGVDMTEWIDAVPAVIEAWYPGQEGGTALSEIVLGEVNPSGRLPVTFEKKWEDNPVSGNYYPRKNTNRVPYREGVFVGYRGYEQAKVEPLFPFGFGLSYTRFEYSDLAIEPVNGDQAGDSEAGFMVSFDVENVGDRAGSEVAQLYVGSAGSSVPRPPKELKGFAKLTLGPGERKRVSIRLNRRAFCYYDTQKKDWRIETGEREILVGKSSAEIELRGKATLSAMGEDAG